MTAQKRDVGDALIYRGIKLKQLSLLVHVQASGQLSRAAAMVNITQPAASRMLAELEQIMGTALTQRHSRGVTLTAAGERLAERARLLLRDLDLAGREVRDIASGRVGTVHLGSVSGPSLDLVLPVVRSLEASDPQLRISIDVDSSDRLSAQLLTGQLDFYLGRVPAGADTASFNVMSIGEEPLSLIVHADHPLARSGTRDLASCLDHQWVMQKPGGLLRNTVEQYLLARRLALPRTIIGTGSVMLTLAFVMRSHAIGVMSSVAADFFAGASDMNAPLAVLPVARDLAVSPYGIVTLQGRAATPAAQTVLKMLRAELPQRG